MPSSTKQTAVLFYMPQRWSCDDVFDVLIDDENNNSSSQTEKPRKLTRRDRAKTLPSALRRSRSKQCEKRVRFADALGLDLEKLQYFVKEDNCVLSYNTLLRSSPQPHFTLAGPAVVDPAPPIVASPSRLVLANFPYRGDHEYVDRTRSTRVCVAALRASGTSVVGQVNVLNVAFDKKVVIRYTVDDWKSQHDVLAAYSHRLFGTEDIDAFSFTVMLPAKLTSGKCEFCVMFVSGGFECWDNNEGSNYVVDVVDDPAPSSADRPYFSASYPGAGYRRTTPVSFHLPPPPPRSSQRRFRRWGKTSDDSDDENPFLQNIRYNY